MAAEEDEETSTSKRVTSFNMLETEQFSEANVNSISSADFTCPICLQILIEPVVMPCEHELCGPCFKQNVEEANFLCPLCRMRISSWARRNSRNGTLVDLKRWKQIQKLFPEKCQKRLRGEDDEDLFDTPPLKRAISQDGEVRKEYEEEMRKLQQAREQEVQASEEVVRKLLEEEQKLARSIEHQALQDEELARQILLEEKEQNSQGKQILSQPSSSKTLSTGANSKQGKGKKIKSQRTQDHHGCNTLDRWFSPTRQPDNQGLGKSRCDLVKNKNHWRTTDSDASGLNYLSHDISDLINERKEQEDRDFQFALKLQKEFDLANQKNAQVERKKGTVDGYMLRSDACSNNAN
ncbi:hypothetical protein ABFA07_014201 [Porites harrisoni]